MRAGILGLFIGGRARRMQGFPKGLLSGPGGKPLVERHWHMAQALGLEVVLVGQHPAYAPFAEAHNLRCLEDMPPGIGPLGGLGALLHFAAHRAGAAGAWAALSPPAPSAASVPATAARATGATAPLAPLSPGALPPDALSAASALAPPGALSPAPPASSSPSSTQGPLCIALACDMPHIALADLEALARSPSQAAALVPRRAYWEPLFARYNPCRVQPALDAFVQAGGRSFQAFLEGLTPEVFSPSSPQTLEDWDSFEQVGGG